MDEMEKLIDEFVTNIIFSWMKKSRPGVVLEMKENFHNDSERIERAKKAWLESQGEFPRMNDMRNQVSHLISRFLPIEAVEVKGKDNISFKSIWR